MEKFDFKGKRKHKKEKDNGFNQDIKGSKLKYKRKKSNRIDILYNLDDELSDLL